MTPAPSRAFPNFHPGRSTLLTAATLLIALNWVALRAPATCRPSRSTQPGRSRCPTTGSSARSAASPSTGRDMFG